MSFYSFMMRTVCTRMDRKRDKGLSAPEQIRRWDDILYGTDEKWNVLDVYRPRDREGALPVIVNVHGGGWVYGNKECYQYYCMDLARRGFAVVNYTYHLAPKYKFPQPLADTSLVFQWVMEHAADYGFDLENIFAVGDSAGAHLISLYCAICTNPDYAANFSFRVPAGAIPKAVALNCGAYDVTSTEGLVGNLIKDFLPKGGERNERKFATPLNHINSKFPPAFIATACKDFVRKDSLNLKNKLNELGVFNEYHMFKDENDTIGHVFHLNIRLLEAQQCNDMECSFFQSSMTREA